MTADLYQLAQALADARAAEARARQDREEVLSDPAFKPAFEALKRADAYIRAYAEQASMQEADVRHAIELHYAKTGEGPDTPGLGIQWRSEPAYDDTQAILWLVGAITTDDLNRDALRLFEALDDWLRAAIAKLRPALNKIILEVKPAFADCTSKRLVPTISDTLNAKLEAAANPPPESMQDWQARDRREHGEAISKLVSKQWGQREAPDMEEA